MSILGRGLIPRYLQDSQAADEASRLKLQRRLALELLVDSFNGSKTEKMEKVVGQRKPTATGIHLFNLADNQHEVTEPALFGVHAADLLSDGGRAFRGLS